MTFTYKNIFGFDVSKYQDDPNTPAVVDFQQMCDYGASFVIIRIGQGNFIDREWQKHELNSRGILPRAGYWFYDPYYDPNLQVELCTTALAHKRLEGRIWLDLEFTWGGNFKAPAHWKVFLNNLKAAGYRTGIYTSHSWWNSNAVGADMNFFHGEPLWQAQYPKLTDLFSNWEAMIHQDGTPVIGLQAGVESLEIDHNRWNSNFDFVTEWGVSQDDTQEEGTMTQVIKGTVLQNIYIRNAPAGTATGDYLLEGNTIEADRNQYQWLHLTKVNGEAVTEESWASAGSQQQYIKWEWVEVTPTPDPVPVYVPPEVALEWKTADGSLVRQAYVVKQ